MVETTVDEQVVDFRLVGGALRRHSVLVAVATVVGSLAGLAVSFAMPPPFVSTSLLLLSDAAQIPGGGPSRVDADTQAQIVRSEPVLSGALDATGLDLGVRELAENVRVAPLTSTLLQVEVAAVDKATAEGLASALASAYVEYAETPTSALTSATVEQLEVQAEDLRAQADRIDEEIARTRSEQQESDGDGGSSGEVLAALTSQRAELAIRLSQLEQDLALAREPSRASAGLDVEIVQDGTAATQSSPFVRSSLAAGLGGLLGLLVGTVIATRMERRDPTVREIREVERALGMPIVAGMHASPRRRPEDWRRLLEEYEPRPADAWVVRRLLRDLAHHGVRYTARGAREDRARRPPPLRLGMIAFDSDDSGQSLAPVLAATAASLGLCSALQDCSEATTATSLRAGLALARTPGLQRERVRVVRHENEAASFDLHLCLMVVQKAQPRLPGSPHVDAALLCLSSGVATVDELGTLALAADDSGVHITGVVIADSEAWTKSGRQPPDAGAPVASTLEDQPNAPRSRRRA